MKRIAPLMTGLATTLALAASPASAQETQATVGAEASGLAAETLADGKATQAIKFLKAELEQSPGDPALLINLGIAQAQSGQEEQARVSFEAALAAREVVDLETANGRFTDSRRLARQAIAMLDRGDFSPMPRGDQLTLRD